MSELFIFTHDCKRPDFKENRSSNSYLLNVDTIGDRLGDIVRWLLLFWVTKHSVIKHSVIM